jgi:hypothetical protein
MKKKEAIKKAAEKAARKEKKAAKKVKKIKAKKKDEITTLDHDHDHLKLETVFGTYRKGFIYSNNRRHPIITYKSLRQEFKNKTGFFLLAPFVSNARRIVNFLEVQKEDIARIVEDELD